MSLAFNLAIVLAALLVEAAIGYPDTLYRKIRHPVSWIGALIEALDRRLNRAERGERNRRLNGAFALAVAIAAAAVPALMLQYTFQALLPARLAVLVLGLIAAMLIAQRSLWSHVEAVAKALESQGLEAARAAAGKIVGRDLSDANEAAVSRAAIESLAENFSDGVVAPAFWCALLGLPGVAAYKAVNTADSMIGHLTPRHSAFGWTSAKLDDLLNLPASRLAAALIAFASKFHRQANSVAAWETILRDAKKHRSPNAGWPEAAFAGALGFKLAGPRSYEGTVVNDAWIGNGRSDLTAADIRLALKLYRTACVVQIAAYALLLLLIVQA